MSEYLVLIYEDENAYATADQATMQQVMSAHQAFGAKHGPALRGSNALQPTTTATSIRRDSAGQTVVTDGPCPIMTFD